MDLAVYFLIFYVRLFICYLFLYLLENADTLYFFKKVRSDHYNYIFYSTTVMFLALSNKGKF